MQTFNLCFLYKYTPSPGSGKPRWIRLHQPVTPLLFHYQKPLQALISISYIEIPLPQDLAGPVGPDWIDL